MKGWNRKIEKGKKLLSKEVERNSELLSEIVRLGKSKLELDDSLNCRLKNVTIRDDVTANLRLKEEENIQKAQISQQGKELDALQQEIQLFRRKGGHIYTTVTSNRQ